MDKNFFNKGDSLSAYDAQYEAQKIAFAPIVFQVVRIMRDKGLLELLYTHRKQGLTFEQISKQSDLSRYAIKVLMETGLSANVVKKTNQHYFITKIGFYLLKDEMTKINMDYNHYVNYQALFNLEESLEQAKPVGLKNFGHWQTIYPGLTSLPEKVRQIWFNFDHYYSDSAFADVLKQIKKQIKKRSIKRILDVGGNTGKFSIFIADNTDQIHLTIVDLEEQIKVAEENIIANLAATNKQRKIDCYIADILDPQQLLPKDYDIIWMSQFLDCFSEHQIVNILKKAAASMNKKTELWIMEPLWDRQKHETSAYCIINTSPYFSCMANGTSKMYHSEDLIKCIESAKLKVIEIIDDLGICQSIIRCEL